MNEEELPPYTISPDDYAKMHFWFTEQQNRIAAEMEERWPGKLPEFTIRMMMEAMGDDEEKSKH